jgi:two-component system, chemotaxis family, protein-glutamate methylesterase/glutaminase
VQYELVVIGTSAGGLEALRTLLRDLAPGFGLPILLVQHRSRDSSALCELLQDCTSLRVQEAVDKQPLEPDGVYLAPPDYHVLVERDFLSLTVDEPVAYSRPSIDVAFETAADAYGPQLIGVVLTGANRDGAQGLRRIADAGGLAIVQSAASAEVPVMPVAAALAVPRAEVLPLDAIAARLTALAAAGRQSGRRA